MEERRKYDDDGISSHKRKKKELLSFKGKLTFHFRQKFLTFFKKLLAAFS
jgi:hypothetical protein